MKNSEKLTNIIESIVFVSGTQISVNDIAEKLEITPKAVLESAKKLQEKYGEGSGIQLLIFNNKLQFCSNSEYAKEVSSVLNPIKEKELSKSMLEVAAIIAYKQPITRTEIEEIRGNSSEYAIQKLLELKVIEPTGRKDAVGRPVLFSTTDEFLKRFQISSIDELPNYEELINSISLLHINESESDYLYQKEVYQGDEILSDDKKAKKQENNTVKNLNKVINKTEEKESDLDLPDFKDEELPEHLIGEDVDII